MERRQQPTVIKSKVLSASLDLLPKQQVVKQSIDKTKYYIILKSLPVLGDFLIASSDTHITVAEIQNNLARMKIGKNWKLLSTDEEIAKIQPLLEAKTQLDEYLALKRTKFELPLDPAGSEFQKRVWTELHNIPVGETISYANLSSKLCNGRGHARAVGAANGSNPIEIFIPCHRVIGSTGQLTGYAAGLPIKQLLLQYETKIAARHRRLAAESKINNPNSNLSKSGRDEYHAL
jgi:methylated-DNA-[protein]-cysteine S-methyltransferase